MDELDKVRKIYDLKSIYRFTRVGDRHESSAEHSWSCLILADYFLTSDFGKIDRLRVYELLMYHDVVEIETGDVSYHLQKSASVKIENERRAVEILKSIFPKVLGDKYQNLNEEYGAGKTLESRFAKAINVLDPMIQDLYNKENWKEWTREVVESKMKYLKEFPVMVSFFDELMNFLDKNRYFE